MECKRDKEHSIILFGEVVSKSFDKKTKELVTKWR